jgi:hypothetical protein
MRLSSAPEEKGRLEPTGFGRFIPPRSAQQSIEIGRLTANCERLENSNACIISRLRRGKGSLWNGEYEAEGKDSLAAMLPRLPHTEREARLDDLDRVQKRRPTWSFDGDEDALASMTAAQENGLRGTETQEV